MKKWISKFGRLFFYLFFVFVPFQVKTLVFTESYYSSGQFNPYLSHFIYLSDVFFLLSFLLFSIFIFLGGNVEVKIKNKGVFLAILLFLFSYFVSLFFSDNLNNSLFYLFRALEFFIVYIMIISSFINLKTLIFVFVSVIGLEALIGIMQYLLQHSIGLSVLGEPFISSSILGVAKINVLDTTILRSYGTFSHPNLFAAYLVFAIYFVFEFLRFSSSSISRITWLFLFLLLIALVLTFSRSAFAVLFVSLTLYFMRTNFFSSWMTGLFALLLFLCLLLFLNLSKILFERFIVGDVLGTIERESYYLISFKVFFSNLFGIGAGNFTSVMQNYFATKLPPWSLQPVHSAYLLSFVELGVLGGTSFLAVIYLVLEEVKKIRIIPISYSLIFAVALLSFLDHYFLTLYQGQVLFWFIIALLSVSDDRLEKIWNP